MDLASDDCSHLICPSISGIRIRRHILGNVVYSTFTKVFFIIVTFLNVFNVFNFYLNPFYMYACRL